MKNFSLAPVTTPGASALGTDFDGSAVVGVVVCSGNGQTTVRDAAGVDHVFPDYAVTDPVESQQFLDAVMASSEVR